MKVFKTDCKAIGHVLTLFKLIAITLFTKEICKVGLKLF